jgi:hypothetical protein
MNCIGELYFSTSAQRLAAQNIKNVRGQNVTTDAG